MMTRRHPETIRFVKGCLLEHNIYSIDIINIHFTQTLLIPGGESNPDSPPQTSSEHENKLIVHAGISAFYS
jgi:hypothetical protein